MFCNECCRWWLRHQTNQECWETWNMFTCTKSNRVCRQFSGPFFQSQPRAPSAARAPTCAPALAWVMIAVWLTQTEAIPKPRIDRSNPINQHTSFRVRKSHNDKFSKLRPCLFVQNKKTATNRRGHRKTRKRKREIMFCESCEQLLKLQTKSEETHRRFSARSRPPHTVQFFFHSILCLFKTFFNSNSRSRSRNTQSASN